MSRSPKHIVIACLAACACLFASVPAATAAEITMMVSNMLRRPITDLMPQFERASGHTINLVLEPAVELPEMIEAGQTADIVIIPSDGIDDFIAKGVLVVGSRTDVAKSLIGVAIRKGAPRPDISSGDALKQSLLASKSIAISGGTSSFYLKDLFQRWGITEAIAPKLQEWGPGTMGIAMVLAMGLADIGFTQATAFVNNPDLEYIGPLPHDIEEVAIFSAGLFRSSTEPDAARALMQFLRGPETVTVLKNYGFEPG